MNTLRTNTIRRVFLGLLAAVMMLGSLAEARPHKRRTRAVEQHRQVVNINKATEDQLQFLPGIGPSKSRAIVHYRAKRKFRSTYQIVRVKGIGRKTYRKLRPHLTLTGPTTASGKIKPRKQEAQ